VVVESAQTAIVWLTPALTFFGIWIAWKQQRISICSALDIEIAEFGSDDPVLEIALVNKGNGPARVLSLDWMRQGRAISLNEVLQGYRMLVPLNWERGGVAAGQLLDRGERIVLLRGTMEWKLGANKHYKYARNEVSKCAVRCGYESVDGTKPPSLFVRLADRL
jgi:hypothetical protein